MKSRLWHVSLVTLVWVLFAAVLLAYLVEGFSDPFDPRATPDWGGWRPRYHAALAFLGYLGLSLSIAAAAEAWVGRTLSFRATLINLTAVNLILLLPFCQYLSISNASELYSYPGDDTGVWQCHSWIPWSSLPARDYVSSFFPVFREPLWTVSMKAMQDFGTRDPQGAARWASSNLMTGPPRPWDVTFTLLNSGVWLFSFGLIVVACRAWAARRRRPAPNTSALVVGAAALVFALGSMNYARFEAPTWLGWGAAHVEAATGTLALYQFNVKYPGREIFVAALRRESGVELRDQAADPSPSQWRFYEAFNRVMNDKIERTIGRTTYFRAVKRAFEARDRAIR